MLGATSSHSGYEAIWAKDRQALLLGAFFHQLHHRYYECNYENAEMPWDRVFGTFHDGSEEATRRTRDRKREMHKRRATRDIHELAKFRALWQRIQNGEPHDNTQQPFP